MEGSGDDIRCASGFLCKLVRVQAGWHVVFDVLEKQFLKALHQDGAECHWAVVLPTGHCTLLRFGDDGG